MKKITFLLLCFTIFFTANSLKAAVVTEKIENVYFSAQYNSSGEITGYVVKFNLVGSGYIVFQNNGIYYNPGSYSTISMSNYNLHKPLIDIAMLAMKRYKDIQIYYDSSTKRITTIQILYN